MVQILVHHVDENNKNIKKRPKDEYLFERWKGFTFLHVAQWSLTYEGSSSLRGYWGCGRWESVEEYIKRDSGMRGLISGWVKTLKRLWTECLIIKKVSENSCECLVVRIWIERFCWILRCLFLFFFFSYQIYCSWNKYHYSYTALVLFTYYL